MDTLSPLAQGRSIRRLFFNGAFWGAYGQLVIIAGTLFTGLALWMGLEASDIALVASIVALAGLVQPISVLISRKLKNQKAFIIVAGFVEITCSTSVVLVPLITGNTVSRFVLVAIMALCGTLSGSMVAPLFNSWFSTLVPSNSLSRIVGRRLVLVNLAAMAVGYGAGRYIDLTSGTYLSFIFPYILAWCVGVGGYVLLRAIPYPSMPETEAAPTLNGSLIGPLKDGRFRRLLAFYLTLVFAALIADPFYSVYMIQRLSISYAIIAILNSVALAAGILGYWLWGGIIAHFGSRPVLQILTVPRILLPLVWVLLSPANARVLLVFIMAINGLVFSGITVAINTLLFGSVPERSERPAYFAIWAFATAIFTSAGTAIGGLVSRTVGSRTISLGALALDDIQAVFVLSSVLLVIPALLIRRVSDVRARPVTHLLGQMLRGGSLVFVYNAFVFARTRGTKQRARAVLRMGRSRSPMAVEPLAQAMSDVDPDVRAEAVKGLGDSKSEDAVHHLVRELNDEESDMRAEAAASLGRLKHPSGIDPLFGSLNSPDSRIAISAARSLGDIGGGEVADRLFQRLSEDPGRALFPTLVESLSRLSDRRVVSPAMHGLWDYRSPVIKLQLLNAVCRVLGARDLFYRLLAKGDYERAEKLNQILGAMARHRRQGFVQIPEKARDGHQGLIAAVAEGRYEEMPAAASELANSVEPRDSAGAGAAEALRIYAEAHAAGEAERPEVFTVVCLGIIFDSLPGKVV